VGPLQVKLEEYPKNQELHKAGKTCKFTSKWYDEYPYLEYSAKRDAAFCFTCRLFPDGKNNQNMFLIYNHDILSSFRTGKRKAHRCLAVN
jgi:hypothetical protein